MASLKWIWYYTKGKRGFVWLSVFFIVIASMLSMVYPLVGGKVIDIVIDQGKMGWLLPLLGIMIVTTFLRTILRYTYQIMFERVGQNALFQIREDLYKKIAIA